MSITRSHVLNVVQRQSRLVDCRYRKESRDLDISQSFIIPSKRNNNRNIFCCGGDYQHRQEATSSIMVLGTFYDKRGHVLDTTSNYPAQTDLDPGQSTPFELSVFASYADKINFFKILADSNDYSSLG